jgi:hypothetical protein
MLMNLWRGLWTTPLVRIELSFHILCNQICGQEADMADYPYTQVAGKMRDFMRRIRETGVPAKVTQQWLSTLGYKSTNDRTLIGVLKGIGLIDSSGSPTDRWRQYRGADSGRVLADGIRLAYKDLFSLYPDACSRSVQELQDFFGSKTSAGQRVVQLTVQTFKGLCEMADMSGSAVGGDAEDDLGATPAATPTVARPVRVGPSSAPPMTVNINVQLTLPETTDENLYDRFFAAFRKYLVDRPSD